MRYLGGKHSIARELASVLESYRPTTDAPFYDVFCGGLSVTAAMSGERHANDACQALITMYEAAASGWRPPTVVTEAEWKALRAANDHTDPRTAFAAFGCSYAGKWFAGYARDHSTKPRNFAEVAARGMTRTFVTCDCVKFTCCDYRKLDVPSGVLAYCDPPYVATTTYAGMPKFDTNEFWTVMDSWVDRGITVLVSEYVAPSGWREVWTRPVRKSRLAGNRVERLFMRDSVRAVA